MSGVTSARALGPAVVEAYQYAKRFVVERGFIAEIQWQESVRLSSLTANRFLSEAAWVVLCSGMRESVIRTKFRAFSAAFYDWDDLAAIVDDPGPCRTRALKVIGHEGKVDAIVTIAQHVAQVGIACVLQSIEHYGVAYLRRLPYLGPVTSIHLAKNLGLDVAKPDRHLVRVAQHIGCEDPHLLCEFISRHVGDRIAVVDLIIWRYATLEPNYLELFGCGVSFAEDG
jgi:hypothetical protein